MLTATAKTEVVNALLVAVETQYKLIGEELENARTAFKDDKGDGRFYGLIGSICCTPDRLENMHTTMKTLLAMAKEPIIGE